MLEEMTQWLVDAIFGMGYWGIFLLMTVESSFIPFPSEVVLVPAGYLAAKGEMHIVIILLCALAGSLTGALINYYGALLIGRRFLERYGRYFFVKPAALRKMDRFFEKHGPVSTFSGRLVPGVRQLISIPAGLARMEMKRFLAYTSLGAGIWSGMLVYLGYLIGDNETLVRTYLTQITVVTLAMVALIAGGYYYWQRKR